MQTNIIKLAPDEVDPAEFKRECILFLLSSRRLARKALRNIEAVVDSNRADRRLAKKYRASANPLLIRNAEVIEARIAERKSEIDTWNFVLVSIGYSLRDITDDIDQLISINELFDILEVNPVDRIKVGVTAGFKEIVFIHGLEDSATYRSCDWKEGPLFKALMRCFDDVMKTDHVLQQKTTDSLFAKGGMFEFVPTYSQTSSGSFVRNPPNLRLADEGDLSVAGV